MQFEGSNAEARRRVLESQNAALHSELAALQESTMQLDMARIQREQHWKSMSRELTLLQHGKLEASEWQVEAREREESLRNEVTCLKDTHAVCEGTVAEIRACHQQTQVESKNLRLECEELSAAWLSATEEAEAMRSNSQQMESQIEQLQQQRARVVFDFGELREEQEAADEQRAKLQQHEWQVGEEEAKLQQEVARSRACASHHERRGQEESEELCYLHSESQAREAKWELQEATLHSQVVDLQKAEVRLEDERVKGESHLRSVTLELEVLQRSTSFADEQQAEMCKQQQRLEEANVQLRQKVADLEETLAKSSTKHQRTQAESRMLLSECEDLNTRWLCETEAVGSMQLSAKKLESQVEQLHQHREELLQSSCIAQQDHAKADAQRAAVTLQARRLEVQAEALQQELEASCETTSRHERRLCEQQDELRQMQFEGSNAEARRRVLESQNAALHSELAALQESTMQLDMARIQREQHWKSMSRELTLLQHGKLEASEWQVEAREREESLRNEVTCLKDTHAVCEGTVAEIRACHQQTQVESKNLRLECEKLSAAWLSATEEAEAMRSNSQQMESQIEQLQQQRARVVFDFGELREEQEAADEQRAKLQQHEWQVGEEEAKLQQEVARSRACASHHERRNQEESEELCYLHSESQAREAKWELQEATLHSQVVDLQKAEVRLEDERVKGESHLRSVTLELEVLQRSTSFADEQQAEMCKQQQRLEEANVQLRQKVADLEETLAKSSTKHQRTQAESRMLLSECEDLNTRWLCETEAVGSMQLSAKKLESQVEQLHQHREELLQSSCIAQQDHAKADAQRAAVTLQARRLEVQAEALQQELEASCETTSRHERRLCEQQDELRQMQFEGSNAEARRRVLESQNAALHSELAALQESTMQLDMARIQREQHWKSMSRELTLLQHGKLEASEWQVEAREREESLRNEVTCLKDTHAVCEGTVAEIRACHQQTQVESKNLRLECEELSAAWLSATEEAEAMRSYSEQMESHKAQQEEASAQFLHECGCLELTRMACEDAAAQFKCEQQLMQAEADQLIRECEELNANWQSSMAEVQIGNEELQCTSNALEQEQARFQHLEAQKSTLHQQLLASRASASSHERSVLELKTELYQMESECQMWQDEFQSQNSMLKLQSEALQETSSRLELQLGKDAEWIIQQNELERCRHEVNSLKAEHAKAREEAEAARMQEARLEPGCTVLRCVNRS